MKQKKDDIPSEQAIKKRPDIFNGPIVPTTVKLSIPILISQILTFAYIIVDTIFISLIDRSSTSLISGAGLVYPIYLIFFTLSRGVFLGMSSLAARGTGQKDENILKKAGDSGLALTLAVTVVMLLIGIFFGGDIVRLLAGRELSGATVQYGIDYFYYMFPCMLLLLLFNLYGGTLQGEGKAKQFGIASMLSVLLNIVLNPILIFGFDMGIKGSGLASSISTALALLYFVFLFAKKKGGISITWNLANTSKKLVSEVLKIGIPASIGMLLINISALVLNKLVGSISENSMDAWVLVSRTDQLFMIPAYAVGLTVIPMIGQNFGRGNLQRAANIFKTDLGLCLVASAVLGALYAVFAPQIFHAFSSVPSVIDAATEQVRYLVIATIALSGITVIGCSFQATGRPLPSLVSNIVRAALCCVPLLLPLFSVELDSMMPIYICFGVANLLTFVLAYLWAHKHFKGLKAKKIVMEAGGTPA